MYALRFLAVTRALNTGLKYPGRRYIDSRDCEVYIRVALTNRHLRHHHTWPSRSTPWSTRTAPTSHLNSMSISIILIHSYCTCTALLVSYGSLFMYISLVLLCSERNLSPCLCSRKLSSDIRTLVDSYIAHGRSSSTTCVHLSIVFRTLSHLLIPPPPVYVFPLRRLSYPRTQPFKISLSVRAR